VKTINVFGAYNIDNIEEHGITANLVLNLFHLEWGRARNYWGKATAKVILKIDTAVFSIPIYIWKATTVVSVSCLSVCMLPPSHPHPPATSRFPQSFTSSSFLPHPHRHLN
jgi:hypothetical protein